MVCFATKNREGKNMFIEITVNDRLYKLEVQSNQRLLDFLRNELGLKGTKHGCEQGECGACSVILNDQLVASCLVLMAQIPPNSEVITIESDDLVVKTVQESFIRKGAVQCGACTPGMVMATTALLKSNLEADVQEIKEALSGVICRCTGYSKIFDAVRYAQKQLGVVS